MRDLIFTFALLSLLPVSFLRPYIGMVVFSWLAYMRPQDLTWGFAKGGRWSFYVAIVMFLGYLVQKRRGPLFVSDPRCYVFVALTLLVGAGVLFNPIEKADVQIGRYVEFVKIVAIGLFTTGVVRNREQLRLLVWVIALSFGFYGVKNGIWGIATLAQKPILRGPGGLMLDNNDFSLALSMAIPMLWCIGTAEKRLVLRRAFLVCVPLTMLTVLMTHSRGGLLAMCAGLGVLVWRSRHRMTAVALTLLAIPVAVVLMPGDMRERFASIADYENDGSAHARFRSWGAAIRMAADNPWIGVGMYGFRSRYLDYQPEPTPSELGGKDIFVAHNSYLQIWAECGTPALLLYLSLIAASLVTVWRVRKEARRHFRASWIIDYATMFEASIAAFIIGSAFLNRAHFDLFYHWVAIILIFGRMAHSDLEDPIRHPLKPGQEGPVVEVTPRAMGRASSLGRRPSFARGS
ncbi:MAG: putative O-glycosylation ligase, exosortase A system-associated [Planctomycetota bacterium]